MGLRTICIRSEEPHDCIYVRSIIFGIFAYGTILHGMLGQGHVSGLILSRNIASGRAGLSMLGRG